MNEKKKPLINIDLPFPRLTKEATKVREVFVVDKGVIFIVTTDRVSAFDVIMKTPIPKKGIVLNTISNFWFRKTQNICPNHFIDDRFDSLPRDLIKKLQPYMEDLRGRFALVKEAVPIPIECVVRGALKGSAKDSYQKTGKVCGIKLPAGLKEGDKFPAPIFTPSTKAAYGEHDENITFEQMSKKIGLRTAQILRAYSLSLYSYLVNFAFLRGIYIPDTKFEFGYYKDQIIQIDESGTPDSSRYVPDYSKQPLRDYLTSIGFDKKNPIELPKNVVKKTSHNYIKGCEIITGNAFT